MILIIINGEGGNYNMQHLDITDVTIVGGGPAGLYASFYSGMRDLSTRIIEYQPKLGGKVHVYPEKMIWDVGGLTPVTGATLIDQMAEQALTFDPEVILNKKVTKIEKNEDNLFVLTSHSGNQYLSKTVILAVGGGILNPIKIDIEGADRFEVTNLHYTVQSLEHFKNKNIIISGGGNSAIDWANELEPIAKQLHMVHRKNEFTGHEAHISQIMNSTANIHFNSTIEKLHANAQGDQIEAVEIRNHETNQEEEVKTDALIISYGYERELTFIKESPLNIEIERDFFVKGTSKSATSIEGLYAAGDILSFDGKVHLIAGAFVDAANAVNQVKLLLEPDATAKARVSSHNDKFNSRNKALLRHLYQKS